MRMNAYNVIFFRFQNFLLFLPNELYLCKKTSYTKEEIENYSKMNELKMKSFF